MKKYLIAVIVATNLLITIIFYSKFVGFIAGVSPRLTKFDEMQNKSHLKNEFRKLDFFFDKRSNVEMKCLYPNISGFDENPENIYKSKIWNYNSVNREIRSLSDSMIELRFSNGREPYAGRSFVYHLSKNRGNFNFLGVALEYDSVRHEVPTLFCITDTNWIASEQITNAGTGVVEKWSRFWKLDERSNQIKEYLAVCTYGKQEASTGDPYRFFSLKPDISKFNDSEIAFDFHARCELIYFDEEKGAMREDGIKLPNLDRKIIFTINDEGRMILNEKKSQLSLKDFKILSNVQLQYGVDFFAVYGSIINDELKGGNGNAIRSWIRNSKVDEWLMSDKEKAMWLRVASE